MKRIRKVVRKITGMIASAAYITLAMCSPALASDTNANVDAVLNPLNMVKALVLAGLSVIGVIIIAVNVMHLSSALKDRDSSTVQTALLGMFGGFIMAAISVVLAFLGFS